MPAISVLTPTYNHEAFIGPCIESVLAQTFDDWEMIVVDDGSTDATLEVARRFRDPRIRVLAKEHRGLERLADTYNEALALARGERIAILEGDDYWPADKLAIQVPAFADPAVVLAYGTAELVTSTPHRFRRTIPRRSCVRALSPDALTNTPPGRALRGFLDPRWLMFTYPCTVILRRSALEAIGGFRQTPRLPVVDYPTFLRLSLEGTFHFTPRVMGYWRVHSSGTTVNRLEAILRGAGAEAAAFRAEFSERMNLGPAELETLDREWRAAAAMLATLEGRRFLVERRWPEARRAFRRALRDGHFKARAGGLLGTIGAWLRRPIEPAYRIVGRSWYRLDANERLEVVT